jgi:hypothetical protein
VALSQSKGISLSHLLSVFGSKKRMSYAMRSKETLSRARLLDYEELSDLAHCLHADRQQTKYIILLGLLELAPKELRSCVVKLVNSNIELASDLGRHHPGLDFSGIQQELSKDL